MALSVVQSTNYSSGTSTAASGTIVFTTTPTQGNLLVVCMSYAGPKHPSSAPAGWTKLDDLENGTSAWLTTYYHVVGASEANSYAFTTTAGDFLSIVAYEITGQATSSVINQHSAATDSANPQSTPSVTPSVVGCLALAFVAYNDGTGMSSTPATVGSGWAMDQDPLPTYHSCVGVHRTSLTTDTTTAINASITWGTGDTDISSTILIAPASGAAPNPGQFFTFLGV